MGLDNYLELFWLLARLRADSGKDLLVCCNSQTSLQNTTPKLHPSLASTSVLCM